MAKTPDVCDRPGFRRRSRSLVEWSSGASKSVRLIRCPICDEDLSESCVATHLSNHSWAELLAAYQTGDPVEPGQDRFETRPTPPSATDADRKALADGGRNYEADDGEQVGLDAF